MGAVTDRTVTCCLAPGTHRMTAASKNYVAGYGWEKGGFTVAGDTLGPTTTLKDANFGYVIKERGDGGLVEMVALDHSLTNSITFDFEMSAPEGVTCGNEFVAKAGDTECTDCKDDGDECCLPKTCGNKDGVEGGAVTCGNEFIAKAGTTACSTCVDNGNECCTPKTCGNKDGAGGAVTCGHSVAAKAGNTACTSCANDASECCLVHNLAEGRPTDSANAASNQPASLAVDGDLSRDRNGNVCYNSWQDAAGGQWWNVDLGTAQAISVIRFYTQAYTASGGGTYRMKGVEASLQDEPSPEKSASAKVCGEIPFQNKPSLDVSCGGQSGRYLYLRMLPHGEHSGSQRTSGQGRLRICELQVFGTD